MADLRIRRRVRVKFTASPSGKPGDARGSGGPSRSGSRPGGKGGAPRVAGGGYVPGSTIAPTPTSADEDAGLAEEAPAALATPDDVTENGLPSEAAQDTITPDFAKAGDGNDNAVADKEKSASSTDGQDTAQNSEEAALNEESKYNPDGAKQRLSMRARMSSTKNRVIAGGVAAIVTAVVGAIIALPGIAVKTFTDLMSNVGQVQVDQQFRYHRKWTHRVSDIFSSDGRRGRALIQDMQTRGYSFRYDVETGKNVVGVKPPGAKEFVSDPDKIGGQFSEYMNDRTRLFKGRWKDKTAEGLYNKFGVKRNSIASLPKRVGIKDRILLNREMREAGSKTKVEINNRANLDGPDEETRAAQQADSDAQRGIVERTGAFDDVGEALDEGVPVEDLRRTLDPDQVDAFNERGAPGEGSFRFGDAIEDGRSLKSNAFGAVKGFFNSADIADKICTINRTITAGIILAREIRAYNMYLSALRYMTASDGMAKGEARSELFREIGKRITNADANGAFIGASAGMSVMLNKGFSKSRNDDAKPGFGVDGKPTGWIMSAYKTSAISGCALWTNGYFQVGLAAAELAITVFTGGGAKAAITGTKEVMEQGIKTAMIRAIRSQITKGIVTGLAVNVTFDGLMVILKMQTERMSAGEFSGQESGAIFADMMFAGAGVFALQRSLMAGQVPTRAADYRIAYNDYLIAKKEEMKNMSVFERYLAFDNIDSLTFRSTSAVAFNSGSVFNLSNNVFDGVLSAPENVASNFMGLVSGRSNAIQENNPDFIPYDEYEFENGKLEGEKIAVDFAGNVLTTMSNEIAAIDPQENLAALKAAGHIDATTLEPTSEQFKGHIAECIDKFDKISVFENDDWDPEKVEQDCFAEKQLTKEFKAHLAYLDMAGTVDAHASPEEIYEGSGQGAPTGPSVPINAEGLNGFVIPCEGQPREPVLRGPDALDWSQVPNSGIINNIMKVYIRDSCPGQPNPKNVIIVGSIHGSENGGQRVAHQLLFKEPLPPDVRIIAIPELCSCAGTGVRGNANGVDLNRNNDAEWASLPQTQTISDTGRTWSKGSAPGSEPETQAANRFLQSLGRSSVSFHYHDNLNYVAASSTNALGLNNIYSAASGMRLRDFVPQRGSLDKWYNQVTGTPTILVEMGPEAPTEQVVRRHVNGVKAVIESGRL